MAIAKYVKAASDRKRYQIDYTDWLDTGEQVLVQSPAIIEWLEERHPNPPLLPADPGRSHTRFSQRRTRHRGAHRGLPECGQVP